MRTKLRETFDSRSYETFNARVVDVVYGPHQFTLHLVGQNEEVAVIPHDLSSGDILLDFMTLIGVEDFSEIEGALVRVLHFGRDPMANERDALKAQGFAHIIEDRTLLLCDYEEVSAPPKVVDLKHVAENRDEPAFGTGGPPTEMTDRYTKAYNEAWDAAKRRKANDATAHYFACRAAAEVDESGIFTMASISPPPGAPWSVVRKSKHLYDLCSESEDSVLATNVDERLVNWLVDEAQIAARIVKCSTHNEPIPCSTCAGQQRGG